MADWPYSTSTWQRLRRAKLDASPLCEPCEKHGRLVPANTVDHVIAIAAGGDPFPPLSGLMAMCQHCHNTKTAALDRAGGSGIAFKGCGLDGFPVDPAHPFNGGRGHTPSKDRALGAPDRRSPRSRSKFGFRGRRWE